MWCWRRLLRVPWSARSNQSILKEINPKYSSERLMLKLKLDSLVTCCKEPTHWKRSWCLGRFRAKGEGGNRGWDGWMASLTQWTWIWANSRRCERQGSLLCCSPWGHKESGMTKWLKNNGNNKINPAFPALRLHLCGSLDWNILPLPFFFFNF